MEKMDTEENPAKWKVTKFKWGRAVPTFLPRALPGRRVVPSPVLCILALCSSLPRPPFCFKTWGSLALPYRDEPLDNNAELCEFGEINSQKSKTCNVSPVNSVPRERVSCVP